MIKLLFIYIFFLIFNNKDTIKNSNIVINNIVIILRKELEENWSCLVF